MRWKTKPTPKLGDTRWVKKFAWFPVETDSGESLWLESYYAAKENNNDDKHSSYDDKEAAEAVCRFLNREHITDGSPCWCEPETVYKDPDTGVSVIVHRRPQ